ALPGGGLMIYHVDDRVSSNNNPDRYRVAVEQADGLFQLENRFSSASPGDEGDPFKEGQRFGRTTNPSSLSNTGEDSFVSVFNIQGPDATGTMSANLRVEPNAIVDIQGVNLVELEGNGNNLLEAGELVGVEPILSVSREPAFDLKLRLTSLDELGEVLDPVLDVGTVPVNQTVTASAMAVRISQDIPSDPYGLRLNLDVDWRDDMGREVTVELGIGTAVGRTDDFETVDHGWVHQRTRTTSVDQWFYGPGVGTDGSAGFKVGGVLFGFARGIDAYLESPPILLPPHAELVYDQILDVIYNDSSKVDAGGIIELSINGGDWTQATPEGDYPARYFGSNTEWDGRRVFAGSVNPLEFETIRFDLSQFAGSVRVRFRFFSDSPSFIGGGWRIDNVIVRSGMTPVRVLEKEAVLRGQDVALSWKLAAPLPAAIRVVRQGAETVPVTDWQAASASGFALDVGAATELPAEYWLEGRERNGELSRWGPWTVERSQFQTQNLMRLLRNPSRLGSLVQFDRPLEQEQQVQVFDIRGRLVRQEALSMGASSWEWDGRTSTGNQVRPGIYFLRVVSWDLAPLRIVRLP
ncbi:MAG: hypothetical protein HKN21_04625, partial [Candidatus Eisenbacteria bacterium]|nr:hypothetical protein [Candidatus Eisenbacteria bacterium]